MENIQLDINNLSFVIPLPMEVQGAVEEFLSATDSAPIFLNLNQRKYVLMSEEDFLEVLEFDDEIQRQKVEQEQFQRAKQQKQADDTMDMVMKLLQQAELSTEQVAHLTEVMAAHYTLAVHRQYYGGEEV